MRRGMKKTYKGQIRWKHFLPVYLMMLPGLAYLITNNYLPMAGMVIAFKDLDFKKGIWGSDWAGFDNFRFLFPSSDAWVMTRNTLLYNIVFIFLGIIFGVGTAILLNEIRKKFFLKFFQTMILIPFLMSWVIVNYLAYTYLSPDTGLVNNAILARLGIKPVSWYMQPKYWPFILTFVNVWKSLGFSTVLYYSALIGISPEYYESASLDGASRWQQIKNITLPLLKPTIITLLILNLGHIFNSDFGLFYQVTRNSGILYPTTRTIDVYVYNALMKNNDYAMSSAASVFQSIVGFITLMIANAVVRKVSRENALF